MKRFFICVLLIFLCRLSYVNAADTLQVRNPQIPILIERQDNVLLYMRLDARETKTLDKVKIAFDKGTDLKNVRSVKLYYGGTECVRREDKLFFSPVEYVPRNLPGKTMKAHPSYSILKQEVDALSSEVDFTVGQSLFPGVNYFWVSLQMKPETDLSTKISVNVVEASADGKALPIDRTFAGSVVRRMGVGVRHAGDDGSHSFRIPGLATTNEGTLLGVYDVRYNSSVDLQEHIDVGLSRSTDGGKTWEKMRLPLAFGEYGGLPKGQNGVGDPAILVDRTAGTVWIVAAWTHGMGNARAWFNSQQGMDLAHTAQLMMTRSDDDGKTWSAPINITEQVKDPSWYFLLQGPGNGITMQDGTLVFATQYIDSTRVPNAGIMYSKDNGKTWKMHTHARTNTTEAQVVELEPGVLMLNMRDNRKGSRAVAVTEDMGRTWTEHPSSRKALREPVCMASLIKIDAKDNILDKDILLFSNPDTTKGRNHITVKASLDGGHTWKKEHQLLLDENEGWGYSCLSRIDRETVGILYESSVAHMTFQAIPLKDIIK